MGTEKHEYKKPNDFNDLINSFMDKSIKEQIILILNWTLYLILLNLKNKNGLYLNI